jgi:hypothetical protein
LRAPLTRTADDPLTKIESYAVQRFAGGQRLYAIGPAIGLSEGFAITIFARMRKRLGCTSNAAVIALLRTRGENPIGGEPAPDHVNRPPRPKFVKKPAPPPKPPKPPPPIGNRAAAQRFLDGNSPIGLVKFGKHDHDFDEAYRHAEQQKAWRTRKRPKT